MTEQAVLLYLIIINAAALLLMLVDKLNAKHGFWRIPEAVLMWAAIFGGSAGALFGMYLFRHKTRHIKFAVGLPLILLLQAALSIRLMA